MSRRPQVFGNWKMNLDFVEALHLVQQLGVLMKNHPVEHTDVVVIPPFVDLRSVGSLIEADRMNLGLGAQHVSAIESGAHTGEISTNMLKRLGVSSVLVGHSERREMYNMDDDVVAATLRAVTRSGLRGVLCVGENLAIRENGDQEEFVADQLSKAAAGLDEKSRSQVTIAYEPLWAIGTGVTASIEQVTTMTAFLRNVATRLKLDAPVLYGGSVTPENADALIRESDVDGFLVGGASLKAESFYGILRSCDDCYARKR